MCSMRQRRVQNDIKVWDPNNCKNGDVIYWEGKDCRKSRVWCEGWGRVNLKLSLGHTRLEMLISQVRISSRQLDIGSGKPSILEFYRKIELTVCLCVYKERGIYLKELAHTIVEGLMSLKI